VNSQIPVVDYLVLEPNAHLTAHQCDSCGARFFDRRNACAACGAVGFSSVDVATVGVVTAFSIVNFAAPGVTVPFVPALIDCDGTAVRGNIIGCPPDPEHVRLGMSVVLDTYSIGTDEQGTEAIGFGFTPMTKETSHGD
jgi:uncharacterized OB-fold protein